MSEAANFQARRAALAATDGLAMNVSGSVEYASRGKVVIIGGQAAVNLARQLPRDTEMTLLTTAPNETQGLSCEVIDIARRSMKINGYLGNFQITLADHKAGTSPQFSADVVVDLTDPPLLSMEMKPPGYLAYPASDGELIEQVQELRGTFAKPRYFHYDPDICAHGRAGITACNRCVEACPAQAITALVETVEVNPFLCQGGGICASVCPTGAIRYAYPPPADTQTRVRTLLATYLGAGGSEPVVVFGSAVDLSGCICPDHAFSVEVEELGSVGPELILAALAMGARSVLLVDGPSVPAGVRIRLEAQLDVVGQVLGGMGYPKTAVRLSARTELLEQLQPVMPPIKPATFAGLNEKRRSLYMAVDHLFSEAPAAAPITDLPAGAPFGRIQVDAEACTLCMSCTSVCPAKALESGNDSPRLVFHETNCVQCGLCASACPEKAITLHARIVNDPGLRHPTVTLHEEPPFCCVSCGKPFASRSMIQNMLERLEGHWMFQDERAKRRLSMCEDCRVIDVVQDNAAMGGGLPANRDQ
ncbi:4Fe-4S binding protein [Thiogranum longum]